MKHSPLHHARDRLLQHLQDPQVLGMALVFLVSLLLVVFIGGDLGPVLAAMVLAYLLEGMVAALVQWRIPRNLAVALVAGTFAVAAGAQDKAPAKKADTAAAPKKASNPGAKLVVNGVTIPQSRFEAIISNLQQGVENQSAARSRIMDADFAQETANLSRAQILQQAGTAMVAQANQLPQQVLSLLR